MSVEGCTQLVRCSEYHKLVASRSAKDYYAMEAWISSYTVEVWKGFLCRGSAEKFLHCGSVEGCIELVGNIEYHIRFLRHGSAKGCTKLVGFIEYHKRFLGRGCMK